MLAEILAEMTGDFPLLTKVFVSERDLYMTQTLAKAAKPVPVIDENGGMKLKFNFYLKFLLMNRLKIANFS